LRRKGIGITVLAYVVGDLFLFWDCKSTSEPNNTDKTRPAVVRRNKMKFNKLCRGRKKALWGKTKVKGGARGGWKGKNK
jgi:hypothetical protein